MRHILLITSLLLVVYVTAAQPLVLVSDDYLKQQVKDNAGLAPAPTVN